MRISLSFQSLAVEVELADTPTSKALLEAVPFESVPTPISTDRRPKLGSRCNVLGRIVGDPRRLAAVRAGQSVKVQRL